MIFISSYYEEVYPKLNCSLDMFGLCRRAFFESSEDGAQKTKEILSLVKFPYKLIHLLCMQQFHTISHK